MGTEAVRLVPCPPDALREVVVRIAICADVHIGNHAVLGGEIVCGMNARCTATLAAFRAALAEARVGGAEWFIVAGDLFHTDRPNPQTVAAVARALEEHSHAMRFVLVAGNHDQRTFYGGDNALAPLASVAQIVDDEPALACDGAVLCVPHMEGPAGLYCERAITAQVKHRTAGAREPSAVVVHFGIVHRDTPAFLAGTRNAVSAAWLDKLLGPANFERRPALFAGDWHERWASEDAATVQCGALCPTGFAELGYGFGDLYIYDTGTRTFWTRNIPGPRFLETRFERFNPEESGAALMALSGTPPAFVRWYVPADRLEEAAAAMALLRASGAVLDGEVKPSAEAAAEVAKQTAARVRKAGSLREAIEAWCASADVPAGVSRDALAAELRKHLGVTL